MPLGFPFRKRFGQHLLQNKNIARKIVSLAELKPGEPVLEIGPGLGVLTEEIIKTGAELVAIEIDWDFCRYLQEKFGAGISRLIEADILKIDLGKNIFSRNIGKYKNLGKFKVISNLPYYLTTPIIFRLLDWKRYISLMILTMQWEVAKRIVAKHGSKDYSPLSISSQWVTSPSLVFKILPGSFLPPPKVKSAVVKMEVREAPVFPLVDEVQFFKMVRTIFSQRRKMVSNTLKELDGVDRDKIVLALERAGLKANSRPEMVSLGELYRLYKALYAK